MWLCQACLWSRVLASRGVEGIGIAEPLRFVGLLNSNNTWWQEEESHNRPDDSLAEGEKKIASKITDDDNDDVQELFISQRLDHFAPSNGRVFNQRYFFSDRFVDPSRELQYALLCVGGEGPMMTKAVLVDSVHCSGDMLELASLLYSEKGASVSLFGLEHRYYGQSYPGRFIRIVCGCDVGVRQKKLFGDDAFYLLLIVNMTPFFIPLLPLQFSKTRTENLCLRHQTTI